MFDNEIDWVTQSESRPKRREADWEHVSSECVKYKAEHMQFELLAMSESKQVFKII
jgi:hypothetical protein